MNNPSPKLKLSPIRRALVLVGAGVLVAAVVLTIHDAIPKQTGVVIRLDGEAFERGTTRAHITKGGETVIDAEARSVSSENGRLRFSFWLAPGEHRIEVSTYGCPPVSRRFDPAVVDTVNLTYACDGSPPNTSD